jgi:hypothetical protein
MNIEYLTRFPDGTLVRWKPLNWAEYTHLVKSFGESLDGAAGWLLCEAAAACCLLEIEQDGFAVEPQDIYAGTLFIIGKQALELTGFIPTVEKVREGLAKARATISSDWYESALSLVCAIFHKDEDDVRKWTHKKFMEYCARVEIVTGHPLTIVDPNDESEDKSRRYVTGPDGRKIPVLTKRDMRKKEIQMDPMPGPGE